MPTSAIRLHLFRPRVGIGWLAAWAVLAGLVLAPQMACAEASTPSTSFDTRFAAIEPPQADDATPPKTSNDPPKSVESPAANSAPVPPGFDARARYRALIEKQVMGTGACCGDRGSGDGRGKRLQSRRDRRCRRDRADAAPAVDGADSASFRHECRPRRAGNQHSLWRDLSGAGVAPCGRGSLHRGDEIPRRPW